MCSTSPDALNPHDHDGPASSLADRALVRVQQELLRRSAHDVVAVVNDAAAAAAGPSTIRSRRNSDGNGGVPLRVEFDVDPPDGCHAGQGQDTGGAKDSGNGSNNLEDSVVPFQLLPFFGLLNDYAQRSLMRQLVDHFQQTTFTPRNAGALLATPRFNDMQLLESSLGGTDDMICDATNGSADAFTYNISDGQLSLGSPRNGGAIDPHCFEEGFIAAEGFLGATSSSSCRNSIGSSNSSGNNVKQRKSSKEPQRVRDTVQAFLDAPVNAAVNVALKCATREASFEEVLSWLLAASTGDGNSFNGNAHHTTDEYTTNSLLSCAFPTR